MVVMDDGWFGKRNDDNSSLGDWQVNEKKLGGSLADLITRVHEQGVKFGIWIEPEMVNEDSDLYLSLIHIFTGSIDISVGGVVALVSMCCAVYLDFKGGNVFVSLLIALAIGLGVGLVQGFLVSYLDIQPVIVTLAGMFFARGMTSIVHTDPFNVQNEAFVKLKDTRVIVPGMGSVNRIGKYVNCLLYTS